MIGRYKHTQILQDKGCKRQQRAEQICRRYLRRIARCTLRLALQRFCVDNLRMGENHDGVRVPVDELVQGH